MLKISPYIMDILKKIKAEWDEESLRFGDKWSDRDRLVVKWNGEPMNNNTPYFWLREFYKAIASVLDFHKSDEPKGRPKTV